MLFCSCLISINYYKKNLIKTQVKKDLNLQSCGFENQYFTIKLFTLFYLKMKYNQKKIYKEKQRLRFFKKYDNALDIKNLNDGYEKNTNLNKMILLVYKLIL
jgi:hypothetical protein